MGQTRIIERRNLQLPNVSLLRAWAESTTTAQIVAGPQRLFFLVFVGETGFFSGVPAVGPITLGGVAGTIIQDVSDGTFFGGYVTTTIAYWTESQLAGIGNINAAVAVTSSIAFDEQQFATAIYQNVNQSAPIAGSASAALGTGAVTIPASTFGEGGFSIIASGADAVSSGITASPNYTLSFTGTLLTASQLRVFTRRSYSQYNQTQDATTAGATDYAVAIATLNRSLVAA